MFWLGWLWGVMSPCLAEEEGLLMIPLAVGTQSTQALFGAPTSKNGIIFLHSRGQNYQQWAYLTRYMSKKGQITMAIDRLPFDVLPPDQQYLQVLAAAQKMIEAGATHLSCVGIDFSASVCAQAASEEPRISRVVMISPDWKSNGLELEAYFRPNIQYLALYSEYDGHAVRTLEELGVRENLIEISSEKDAMGAKLLLMHPKMEADMVQWLLKDPQPNDGLPRIPVKPLHEEIVIETKGEKLPW